MGLFRRHGGDGDRWLVLGLGNPGEKYAATRHNAGAMVIDVLLDRSNARLKSHRSGCLVAEVTLSGSRAVLARTTGYMNESGRPAGQLTSFYKVHPERLLVVHDELDLPFGEIRLKQGGGTAGHNGLKSLGAHLRTKDFPRVRFGIGRPRGQKDPVAHVLERFSAEERAELPMLIERAADGVEAVLADGLDRAMNEFNTRA